ncbi:hypothetical protein SAMN04487820_10944 [Actinopolyspora mzabensis]|uniref:Uncharacterized protein n=1 Tax=Actinopolyspora mzabensis TaxID=995066 RepID=A0A1G9CQX1_ACTMZ|nr:hypothetical protein [Actinopolyspora mzabensis]SDK54052.1 hypothetical protein SAMN04487820_10944 [Actinopolyspora mzabensis]
MTSEIIQLISAEPGYYLRNEQDDQTFYTPIAAWALMEDKEGTRWIEPVDPTGDGWDGQPEGNGKEVVHVAGTIEGENWPPHEKESSAEDTLSSHTRAMRWLVKALGSHEKSVRNLIGELDAHATEVKRALRGR